MLKIVDIKISSNYPIAQTALVGNPVDIEVEVLESNWLHIFSNYNSWLDVKNSFLNWEEIKNI